MTQYNPQASIMQPHELTYEEKSWDHRRIIAAAIKFSRRKSVETNQPASI